MQDIGVLTLSTVPLVSDFIFVVLKLVLKINVVDELRNPENSESVSSRKKIQHDQEIM
jgi:hypothetical protein